MTPENEKKMRTTIELVNKILEHDEAYRGFRVVIGCNFFEHPAPTKMTTAELNKLEGTRNAKQV